MNDSNEEFSSTEGELSPLRQARQKIQEQERKREKKGRSEVRGTRLTEDEAIKLDAMAEKAGLSISTLIRVICLSEDRPDKKLLVAALREVQSLVRDLALKSQAGSDPTSQELIHLHEQVEETCRGLT